MSKRNFFEQRDEKIVFTGEFMEAYIPEFYFTSNIAYEFGDVMKLYGIFNYVNNPTGTSKDVVETCFVPFSIITKPSSIEKRVIELIKGNGEVEYRVFKYYNGDNFLQTRHMVKDVSNVEVFFKLMNAGKIPNTIPYTKLIEMTNKCLSMNGINIPVPQVTLQAYISEICRDASDKSKPYRIKAGKSAKVDEFAYKPANLREISRVSSTFAAITFEDIDAMITSSIVRTRTGGRESYSPLEKIMKY